MGVAQRSKLTSPLALALLPEPLAAASIAY